MKIVLAIMGLFLALNTQARSEQMPVQATVEGKVKFTKSFTVTCMAIGCPPSRMYYKFELVDAKVEGVNFTVQGLEVLDASDKYIGTAFSRTLLYGGARLKDGMRVRMTGDVFVDASSSNVFAYFTNPTEVKVLKN